MPIKFTLQETLDREELTRYAVAKKSGVRPNTMTDLCNGDARSLRVETMDAVINAINELANAKYGLDAIMVYEDAE